MVTALSSEPTDDGFAFRLERSRLIGGKVRLPVKEWAGAPGTKQLAGISQLLAWVDEEQAVANEDTVVVPFGTVAKLSTSEARSLSVAPDAPFVLDVQHIGIISDQNFRFRTTWLQPNGQPVLGARQLGSALIVGSRHFRIPDRLFAILTACEDFNK